MRLHSHLIVMLMTGLAACVEAQLNTPNQPPYLSTYYIEPNVPTGQPAVIRYYVTDFFQTEYMTADASERFTVDYWVNGAKQTLTNVPPGDNRLDLDPLPEGPVLFALQATDRFQHKSHRLFQEFRVVDPAEEIVAPGRILNPDLAAFAISNQDAAPAETTLGLTAMLGWAASNGYRKVVLPAGTYRIHETGTVQMASGIILDMNGSTFKLNPNARGSCLMLEFVNCLDSHVINGTFEGDLYQHDFTNAPNNSEWVNGMSISQGSEYCSVENVTIRNFPGYGTCSNHRHTYNTSKSIGNHFRPGDVDGQGLPVASTLRVTNTNLIDVSAFVNSYKFFQLGLYLGYQGNPAGNWVYKAHLYDAGTNYLESIEGYMYRRLYPPPAARYARFTLYTTLQPADLQVYNFRAPYNCAYKNIRHENIRCVGMALAGFDNFLVEGCRFDNCGWAAANCAFDAEDGWDLMHDLTFRNNIFGTNPANEFLTCGGHNFMMENNEMKAYIWDRTRNFVLRNNRLKSATYRFGRNDRTGYVRVTNNVSAGAVNLQSATASPDRAHAVRNETCLNGISGPADGSSFFYQCAISGGAVNAKAVGCDIRNMTNAGAVFELVDCTIANSLLKTSGYKALAQVRGSVISNCHAVTQGGTLILANNRIINSDYAATGDWSDGHELILVSNIIDTALPTLVYIGNSFKQVVLANNTITATHTNFSAVQLWNPTQSNLTNQVVEFRDNTVGGQGGCLLRVDRLPHPACTLTARFIRNRCTGLDLFASALSNQPNVLIQVIPAGVAEAGTSHWSNAAGGAFEAASNWSNGAAPGALDVALFNLTNDYTVTWAATVTNRYVSVQKGAVVWDLRGSTYYFTPSNDFSLAAGAPVSLTLTNGRFSITDTSKGHYLYLVGAGALGGSTVRVTEATVISARLFLGNAAGDKTALLLDGPNARWYEPYSGYCNWGGGSGSRISVTITNGACMRLGGNLNLACAGGAQSLVEVTGSGSAFTNGGFTMPYQNYTPAATARVVAADSGRIFCTGSSTVRSNGLLRLSDGQFWNSSTNLTLDIHRGGLVEGTGSIRAKVRNMGGLIRPGGVMETGTLSVTGDVYNSDSANFATGGVIQIELAGLTRYDRLSVQGALRAAGTLSVSLINGYQPGRGSVYKILDFSSLAGSFSTLDLPGDAARWNMGNLYRTGEIAYSAPSTLILVR